MIFFRPNHDTLSLCSEQGCQLAFEISFKPSRKKIEAKDSSHWKVECTVTPIHVIGIV